MIFGKSLLITWFQIKILATFSRRNKKLILTKQNNIFFRFSTEKIRELHSYYENIYLSDTLFGMRCTILGWYITKELLTYTQCDFKLHFIKICVFTEGNQVVQNKIDFSWFIKKKYSKLLRVSSEIVAYILYWTSNSPVFC